MGKTSLLIHWLLATSLLVLTVTAAQAEIYRWVDKDGNVHFSDEKPAQQGAEVVKPEIAEPSATPDEGELRRRSYLDSVNDPRYTPAAQAPPNEVQSRNATRCRRARVEYGILGESVPAYRTPSGEIRAAWSNDTYQGQRDYIDDADRQAVQDQIWSQVHQYCDNPTSESALVEAWNTYVDGVYCSEHEVKLERAREQRTRTSRQELARIEAEYASNCN